MDNAADEPEELERLAVDAYLRAADDPAALWARAHEQYLRRGRADRAVWCAIWLASCLMDRGEPARGAGWLTRAQQLVDQSGLDCVECGYLLVPQAIGAMAGEPGEALRRFVAARGIGERFADAGLGSVARMGQCRALIAVGRGDDAAAPLDEAMVMMTARLADVPPIVAGMVYCGAIEACQEMADFGRAREWTVALSRWCDAFPDRVAFRGQCLVHRAEVMQLQGDWDDAQQEARRACSLLARDAAFGNALYRAAELHRLRGEWGAAHAAYLDASRAGYDPQPGLALLHLAEGRADAAAGTAGRLLQERSHGVRRALLLGPCVEILLAVGDIDTASAAAKELRELARQINRPHVDAVADHAGGAVLLASGDPAQALALLRRAWSVWRTFEIPYEAARARVLIGLCYRAMGDHDGAQLELDAARLGFQLLGAAHDVARTQRLRSAPTTGPGRLSRRELDVVAAVCRGLSNRQIAAELVISEHTVARHLQNIFAKLAVPSRAALVAHAHDHDLLKNHHA